MKPRTIGSSHYRGPCPCGSGLRAGRSYCVARGLWVLTCAHCRPLPAEAKPQPPRIGVEVHVRNGDARRKLELLREERELAGL